MAQVALALLLLIVGFNSARAERLATTYTSGLLDDDDVPPPPRNRVPEAPLVRPHVTPPGGTLRAEPLGLPRNPPRIQAPPQRPPAPPVQRGTPAQFRHFEQFPVWAPFYSKFKKCEPGCEPRVNNLLRRGDPRCHGVGAAIDIDGIICGNQAHRALNNPRFEKMVNCMRYEQRMLTLWKNGRHITQGHHDHVHFSIGCHSGY